MPINPQIVFLTVLLIFAQMSYAQTASTVVLSDGFENGFEEKWNFVGMDEADKINHAVTTLEAKSGIKSMYFKAWQKPATSTKNIYRTEITAKEGGVFNAGNEYCLKFFMKVKNWTTVPSWNTILQTHAVPSSWDYISGKNSLTLSIKKEDGVDKLVLSVIKIPRLVWNGDGSATGSRAYATPVTYNRWYAVVFRYRPSFYEDGIIEAWFDGQKIYEQFGGNMDWKDSGGFQQIPEQYLKLGIYKNGEDLGTQEIFYDDVEIKKGANACGQVGARLAAPSTVRVN
jgi:hypothetical protein